MDWLMPAALANLLMASTSCLPQWAELKQPAPEDQPSERSSAAGRSAAAAAYAGRHLEEQPAPDTDCSESFQRAPPPPPSDATAGSASKLVWAHQVPGSIHIEETIAAARTFLWTNSQGLEAPPTQRRHTCAGCCPFISKPSQSITVPPIIFCEKAQEPTT